MKGVKSMSMNPRPTRSEQREQARNKARELREQKASADKRKRALTITLVSLLIAGVLAGVSYSVITFNVTSSQGNANAHKVPANVTAQGGVLLGKDFTVVTPAEAKTMNHIVIYQDYQCPICQMFENPNATQIGTWIKSGQAVLEYHPISFLDGHSLNDYSSRAANAAFCVANSQPDKFFAVNTALYANQPQENTAGPSDSQIKTTLSSAGVDVNSEINTCVDQKRYAKFIENKTSEAFTTPAVTGTDIPTGTPDILVNGVVYTWDGDATKLINPGRFAQFFQANQKNK
jgi:protein-disulfide isomerase